MNRLVSLGTKRIPIEGLDRIHASVHLIWGRHDQLVPLKTAAEHHRWSLHLIEDATHAPHLEPPDASLHVLDPILGAGWPSVGCG